MEDVLDLYAEDYKQQFPVVCFDETSKQLIKELRPPLSATSGKAERFDYEYTRNGVANLFMFCEPKAGWRHIEVTERHTKQDFAKQMRYTSISFKTNAEFFEPKPMQLHKATFTTEFSFALFGV
jgi:hypothetical protein